LMNTIRPLLLIAIRADGLCKDNCNWDRASTMLLARSAAFAACGVERRVDPLTREWF